MGEDASQSGDSTGFRRLNVKVERGLETDKKFFCLLDLL